MNEFNFESIQAGEKVLWFNANHHMLRTVVRTTGTQIITENERKFRKTDGRPVGEKSLYAGRIRRISAEEIAKLEEEEEHERLVSIMRKKDWNKVSSEALGKILLILASDKLERVLPTISE